MILKRDCDITEADLFLQAVTWRDTPPLLRWLVQRPAFWLFMAVGFATFGYGFWIDWRKAALMYQRINTLHETPLLLESPNRMNPFSVSAE